MDTGNPLDRVYTRDLFTLQESPRLGVGVMEMTDTTFPWTLRYDEMDYVLSGRLDIRIGGETVSAGPGKHLYPKEQSIQFSVTAARFLYFVYRRLAEPGRLIPGGRPSATTFFAQSEWCSPQTHTFYIRARILGANGGAVIMDYGIWTFA